jgi:Skp family chaperone for outer membrane proteins
MMRLVQIHAFVAAAALQESLTEGHLRNALTQSGSPDNFADIDAKLKALEEKTKAELAKLQSDTAAPSSFVEEGAPDFSMPEIDAKLKALGEKMKAEVAQLHAGPALPSSFVEVGAPDSFADIDAKLKALEEKTKAELAKLQSDTAAPSSFL